MPNAVTVWINGSRPGTRLKMRLFFFVTESVDGLGMPFSTAGECGLLQLNQTGCNLVKCSSLDAHAVDDIHDSFPPQKFGFGGNCFFGFFCNDFLSFSDDGFCRLFYRFDLFNRCLNRRDV